jgi:hypothetical protein
MISNGEDMVVSFKVELDTTKTINQPSFFAGGASGPGVHSQDDKPA